MFSVLRLPVSVLAIGAGNVLSHVTAKLGNVTHNALYESCLAVVKRRVAHLLSHDLSAQDAGAKPETAVRMDFAHSVNIRLSEEDFKTLMVSVAVLGFAVGSISAGFCLRWRTSTPRQSR